MTDPNDEQERCPWCNARKFDPPKKKCDDVLFHWLLAGREWKWIEDDKVYRAVETRETVKASYDGLIKVEEAPEGIIMPKGLEGKHHTFTIIGVKDDGSQITWKSS